MSFKKVMLFMFLFVSTNIFAEELDGWLDVDVNNGQLLIDVEIGGVVSKALLDTGATSMAVNVDFLHKHKIPYKKGRKFLLKGIYGEKKVHEIKKLQVKLFGIQTPISRALPFEGGGDIAMIIGLPFFKNFVIQIDYPNSRLKLIPRSSLDLKKLANVKMKHGNNNESLVVTGHLENGDTINLLFDTGSNSGLLLKRVYADQKGWLQKYKKAKISSSGVVEARESDLLVLPYFKFGPYELADVIVNIPSDFTSSNISQKQQVAETGKMIAKGSAYEGVLGYDILKHFVITLDAKSASMHIIAP